MRPMKMTNAILKTRLLLAAMVAVTSLTATAHAAAPGITGPTFNLIAQTALLNQPDGNAVYSWGYGCNGAPAGFAPAAITNATCPTMQVPGPTLIVTEGQTVTVNLTNNLPSAAGNTSILFPGFTVTRLGRCDWPDDPGGGAGRHCHLHVYCFVAGHPLLLQRNARRPAGRDGPVRRGHCAPGTRSRRLHRCDCDEYSCQEQARPKPLGRIRFPAVAGCV